MSTSSTVAPNWAARRRIATRACCLVKTLSDGCTAGLPAQRQDLVAWVVVERGWDTLGWEGDDFAEVAQVALMFGNLDLGSHASECSGKF